MKNHKNLIAFAALTLTPTFLFAQEVNILDEGNFETTVQNMPSGFH